MYESMKNFFISLMKSLIPFHSIIPYLLPKFALHFIFHSIPFHSIPLLSCLLGVRSTKPVGTRYGIKLKTVFGFCHSVMRRIKIFIIIIFINIITSSLIASQYLENAVSKCLLCKFCSNNYNLVSFFPKSKTFFSRIFS